uniref:Complement C5a receptor 2 n=1 Tax=Oryctolagus cuniculus TaxID=9986 RepID=A0A5F9CKR0_RABIT
MQGTGDLTAVPNALPSSLLFTCWQLPASSKASGTPMENTSLSYDYGDYSDLLDLPVDCPDGTCLSARPGHVAPLLLYAAIFLVGCQAMPWWPGWPGGRPAAPLGPPGSSTWPCGPALLPVPPHPGRAHSSGATAYGAVGCWALPSVILTSMYASVLLLAALSADLCLLALWPTWWAVAWRAWGVRLARAAAWVLAVLLTVPSAIHRRLHQEHFPSRLECVVDYGGSAAAEHAVTAARFLLGFLGPLAVVAGCFGAVLCRGVRRHRPLCTAVIVGFFVCWAPYHLLGLVLAVATPNSALLVRALKAEPLVVGLALAHSCLNPLLFLYFGRAQLRQSLAAACRWALRESQGEDESVVSKTVPSHDLVSEMEV